MPDIVVDATKPSSRYVMERIGESASKVESGSTEYGDFELINEQLLFAMAIARHSLDILPDTQSTFVLIGRSDSRGIDGAGRDHP